MQPPPRTLPLSLSIDDVKKKEKTKNRLMGQNQCECAGYVVSTSENTFQLIRHAKPFNENSTWQTVSFISWCYCCRRFFGCRWRHRIVCVSGHIGSRRLFSRPFYIEHYFIRLKSNRDFNSIISIYFVEWRKIKSIYMDIDDDRIHTQTHTKPHHICI